MYLRLFMLLELLFSTIVASYTTRGSRQSDRLLPVRKREAVPKHRATHRHQDGTLKLSLYNDTSCAAQSTFDGTEVQYNTSYTMGNDKDAQTILGYKLSRKLKKKEDFQIFSDAACKDHLRKAGRHDRRKGCHIFEPDLPLALCVQVTTKALSTTNDEGVFAEELG
ncbi:hypothetical protein ACLMJK_007649 [Lecanora helva]